MLFTELFPCKEKIFVGAGSWQKGFLLLQHSIFCGRETNDNFFGRIFPCMSRLRYVSPLGSCHTSKIELLERYILIRIWTQTCSSSLRSRREQWRFSLVKNKFSFFFLILFFNLPVKHNMNRPSTSSWRDGARSSSHFIYPYIIKICCFKSIYLKTRVLNRLNNICNKLISN